MSEWETAKIPEVVFFQEGPGVRNTQYTNSGVKLLNVANLQNGKVVLETSQRYISEEEANGKYNHFLVDDGDLIIASSGIKVEYFDKKMGFVDSSQLPLCMNTSTIRFKPLNKNILDIKFFMYYLKTDLFKAQLDRLITGSAQLNFGPSHLKQIRMPLPSLETQNNIADILDKASSLIELRKAQIEKLDLLVKSQFIEIFGDPVTNPKGWKKSKLGDLFKIQSGGTPSTLEREYWENGSISWIGSNMCQNCILYENDGKYITELGLENSSAKMFECGTVLVALVGATIGKTALLKFRTTTNQNIAGIDVNSNNDFLPEYVYYLMQGLYGEFMKIGEGKFKMASLGFLKNLDVICPPLILQNQFAAFVEQVDKSKFEMQQGLEKLQTNYNALMQRCFSGELFS